MVHWVNKVRIAAFSFRNTGSRFVWASWAKVLLNDFVLLRQRCNWMEMVYIRCILHELTDPLNRRLESVAGAWCDNKSSLHILIITSVYWCKFKSTHDMHRGRMVKRFSCIIVHHHQIYSHPIINREWQIKNYNKGIEMRFATVTHQI